MTREQLCWELRLQRSGMTRMEFAIDIWRDRNVPKAEREASKQKNRPHWILLHPLQPLGFKTPHFWMPHPLEVRACCQQIEPPHPGYPFMYHRHCRTAEHVAMIAGVEAKALRKALGMSTISPRCSQCSRFRPKDDYLCTTCRRQIDNQ